MIHVIVTSIFHSQLLLSEQRQPPHCRPRHGLYSILQARQKVSPSPHFTHIRFLMWAADERMSCCQLQLTIDGVDRPTDLATTCGFPDNPLFLWAPDSVTQTSSSTTPFTSVLTELFSLPRATKTEDCQKDLIMMQSYLGTQHKPSASTVCCTTWRQRLKVQQLADGSASLQKYPSDMINSSATSELTWLQTSPHPPTTTDSFWTR